MTRGGAEALIRIRQVGVCGTDYHAFHGNQPFFTYPRILGHELGVEIEAVGTEVCHLLKGDYCAVRSYLSCGSCPACLRGKPNCCIYLQVFGVHVDGGLREFAALPADYLHPARTLTVEQLALVEPLAIGAHAVAGAELLLLDQFDARQILHVTFGSVLTAQDSAGNRRFSDRLMEVLNTHLEAYTANLKSHFLRHLRPFAAHSVESMG